MIQPIPLQLIRLNHLSSALAQSVDGVSHWPSSASSVLRNGGVSAANSCAVEPAYAASAIPRMIESRMRSIRIFIVLVLVTEMPVLQQAKSNRKSTIALNDSSAPAVHLAIRNAMLPLVSRRVAQCQQTARFQQKRFSAAVLHVAKIHRARRPLDATSFSVMYQLTNRFGL
jgi:hypothetical protein